MTRTHTKARCSEVNHSYGQMGGQEKVKNVKLVGQLA